MSSLGFLGLPPRPPSSERERERGRESLGESEAVFAESVTPVFSSDKETVSAGGSSWEDSERARFALRFLEGAFLEAGFCLDATFFFAALFFLADARFFAAFFLGPAFA